jgi:tetratricopeptide (TPR) repeat protein
MGICYEILEDNESALKYYKLAHQKNEEFVNPIFHIGCIYDKMKNPESIKWLEIAYEREKENVDYLQKYGDVLVQTDNESNISKGILILEKGFEFFTGNIEIISSLAKGYEKQGKLKEAIQLLEKAKNNEEFSNNKSKVFQLASYYEKAKELTKSIEFFKKVLSLDKRNVEALLHIGYIYRSIKENVKAFKCFKQILLAFWHLINDTK